MSKNEVMRAKQNAVGGKRDRCRKGKSCSATCISQWKVCLVEVSSGILPSLDKVKHLLLGGTSNKGKERDKKMAEKMLNKLMSEMEKTAVIGDRAKYDKLENEFFKVKANQNLTTTGGRAAKLNERGEVWEDKSLPRLQRDLNTGRREGVEEIKVSGDRTRYSSISRVLGNKLDILVSPNSTTEFKVNDSLTSSGNLSRRERVAIIREVTRQYDKIIGSMENGTVLKVSASEGDSRENMRVKAYTGYGFSKPDYNGSMYGMVENGKIVPITEDKFTAVSKEKGTLESERVTPVNLEAVSALSRFVDRTPRSS